MLKSVMLLSHSLEYNVNDAFNGDLVYTNMIRFAGRSTRFLARSTFCVEISIENIASRYKNCEARNPQCFTILNVKHFFL